MTGPTFDDRHALPPSTEELEAALGQLTDAYPVEAALHLALPVGQVLGIHAQVRESRWHWRGASVAAGTPAAAVLLSELGSLDSDRFLDLDLERGVEDWLKVRRSGAYLRVFGAELLLGTPPVAIDPDLGPELREVLRLLVGGELTEPGDTAGGVVLSRTAVGWLVEPAVKVPLSAARVAAAPWLQS